MSQEQPRRRWFSFSMRTMFVVLTVGCVLLGYQVNLVRQRQSYRNWLRDGGGGSYTWQDYKDTPSQPARHKPDPSVPIWRTWLGDEPMAVIYFEPSATKADRDRARKLFPEALNIYDQ